MCHCIYACCILAGFRPVAPTPGALPAAHDRNTLAGTCDVSSYLGPLARPLSFPLALPNDLMCMVCCVVFGTACGFGEGLRAFARLCVFDLSRAGIPLKFHCRTRYCPRPLARTMSPCSRPTMPNTWWHPTIVPLCMASLQMYVVFVIR
jgi:hypothetical protein